ncbi:MAG: hypothetical protein LIP16_17985 [Clostridium sp.]|nr:hypothetical protein [Clostridium sp.]
MTALVLYAADKYLKDGKRKAVIEAAKSSLCEGMHLEARDVTVVLEAFKEGESNERVTHCFFPVLYTPEGTPYAYKKRAGELMNERLRALFDEEEIGHVYFHMKEHGYDNVAVNGRLLKYDDKAIKHLDETRGVNSTPWLD